MFSCFSANVSSSAVVSCEGVGWLIIVMCPSVTP